MQYMTTQQAAQKWGVSLRYVQRLVSENRILGVQKHGRAWMIPADAKKPLDPRNLKSQEQIISSPYLTCVLLSSVIPMPIDEPDAVLSSLADESQRAQYRAELSYLRADYDAVKTYYRTVSQQDATYLCAANITICAAMCTRDYPLFKAISASVLEIEKNSPSPEAKQAASLIMVLAAVCMNAPSMAPDWLRTGDFGDFPSDTLPMLIFMRAKYLQSIGKNAEMLATSQTALEIFRREDKMTLVDIYLTCFCACGCYGLDRPDNTREYLERSIYMCEKGGFVSPLGEYTTWVGGFLEIALKTSAPAFEQAVEDHIELTLKNWLFFHNEFARDNASLILTTREYQLALLLKEGKTYAQAAEQLCISVGRVKNLISIIYGKLGISKKAEIKKYVF